MVLPVYSHVFLQVTGPLSMNKRLFDSKIWLNVILGRFGVGRSGFAGLQGSQNNLGSELP
jgi:hypothetical protein